MNQFSVQKALTAKMSTSWVRVEARYRTRRAETDLTLLFNSSIYLIGHDFLKVVSVESLLFISISDVN